MKNLKLTVLIVALTIAQYAVASEPESPNLENIPYYLKLEIAKHLVLEGMGHMQQTCKAWQNVWDDEQILKIDQKELIKIRISEEKSKLAQNAYYELMRVEHMYSESSTKSTLTLEGLKICDKKMKNHHNPVFLQLNEVPCEQDLNATGHLGQLVNTLGIYCPFQYIDAADLARICNWVPALKKLQLFFAGSITLPAEFANLINLIELELLGAANTDPISQESLRLICGLPYIQMLSLRDCGITEFPKNITNLLNLKSLELPINHCTQNGILAICNSCKNLENLSFVLNSLSEIPLEIANIRNLRNLNLSDNQFKTAASIRPLCFCTHLEKVNLSNNELIKLPEELELLSQQLKSLDLSGNSNLSFASLELVCKLKKLEELDISLVTISNNFIKLPLRNLQCLKKLKIGYNWISQESIKHICESLPHLEELSLRSDSLQDLPDEIDMLSKTLKTLDLRENNFDEQTRDDFKQLLPNTEILF